MPPRSSPTARQRRLGAELRKLREQAGLNAAQAGAELGADRTGISNMESGRFGVSAERVRCLATIYACPEPHHVDALVAMAEARGSGWWEDYRGLLSATAIDLAELECHAVRLTSVQLIYVPGILQTEEYARQLFQNTVPRLSPVEVQRRVTFRMARKRILERAEPVPCRFIVHEAALRMLFPGRAAQVRQLERLAELSHQPGISIRVLPFRAGGFPGAGSSSWTYLNGPVGGLDTVALDTAHGSVFLDAAAQLENYRSILEQTVDTSLAPDDSRDFIHALTKEL